METIDGIGKHIGRLFSGLFRGFGRVIGSLFSSSDACSNHRLQSTVDSTEHSEPKHEAMRVRGPVSAAFHSGWNSFPDAKRLAERVLELAETRPDLGIVATDPVSESMLSVNYQCVPRSGGRPVNLQLLLCGGGGIECKSLDRQCKNAGFPDRLAEAYLQEVARLCDGVVKRSKGGRRIGLADGKRCLPQPLLRRFDQWVQAVERFVSEVQASVPTVPKQGGVSKGRPKARRARGVREAFTDEQFHRTSDGPVIPPPIEDAQDLLRRIGELPGKMEREVEDAVKDFLIALGHERDSIQFQRGRMDLSVATADGRTSIVFEVKQQPVKQSVWLRARDQAKGYAQEQDCPLFVVTDADAFWIYDRRKGDDFDSMDCGNFRLTKFTESDVTTLGLLRPGASCDSTV